MKQCYLCGIVGTTLTLFLAANAGADWRAFFGAPASAPATQVQRLEKSPAGGVTGGGNADPGNASLADIFQPYNGKPLSDPNVSQAIAVNIVMMCPLRYLYLMKQAKGTPSVLAANSLYKSDSDLMKTCSAVYEPSYQSNMQAAVNFACRYAQCHKNDEDGDVSAIAAKINAIDECPTEDNIPEEKCPTAVHYFSLASNDFPGFGSFLFFKTGLASLLPKEGLTLGLDNPNAQPADELVLSKGLYIIGGLVKPFLLKAPVDYSTAPVLFK